MSQSQTEVRPENLTNMKVEPQEQHRWLHKLVGEWTYESNVPAHSGQPASKVSGSETVRSLGDIWILAEGRGEMPGAGPATTLLTLGYDPHKKRFVGSWIGSMMTHFWIYDGELDAARRVLTLHSEGPSMADDGTMAEYQDVIELKSDDHRTLTARARGEDGKWTQMMVVEYRRSL
jgi:Protein of unknown function (DUF1579)